MSAPGRLAVAFAASLALASSAGCMSVSDDKSGKPAPSKSVDRTDTVAEPDGGHAVGPGGRQAGGRAEVSGETSESASGTPKASPSPSGKGSPAPTPGPSSANRPKPPGAAPSPTRGGQPSAPATPSAPPQQQTPTAAPPESPTPQPTEPTEQPTASSAPEVQAGAAMRMTEADGPGMRGEPLASPQMGPV
ncbi:hypothetical protein FFZ77_23560 [Streptomyces katsurahamanus]|uniref:Uncharacterized protein n=1 Tax=Streptomyces katsurahamanus TaxID=2577098 RepID=A0ABW9NYS2_9ACTN|nr:hypothetical protein [Streptomyces katsurahamanus]